MYPNECTKSTNHSGALKPKFFSKDHAEVLPVFWKQADLVKKIPMSVDAAKLLSLQNVNDLTRL